jgi:membrane protein
MSITRIWLLLKITFSQWREDQASLMAAALAYYTVFSLAPLLIIVIAIAGRKLFERLGTGFYLLVAIAQLFHLIWHCHTAVCNDV